MSTTWIPPCGTCLWIFCNIPKQALSLTSRANAAGRTNSGFGSNAGTGTGGRGGVSANEGSNNSYGSNVSEGLSYQHVERRVLLPQELMDMEPGNSRVWLPGMGSESIPFFAPNYWWRRSPFVAHVRPNPYRQD